MSQSPSSSLLRPLVVLVPGIGGSVLADACARTVYDVNASKGVARVLDPAALAVDNELRATKPISSYGIASKQLVTGYENLWAALVQGLGLSQAETAVAGERLVRPNASLLAFPAVGRTYCRALGSRAPPPGTGPAGGVGGPFHGRAGGCLVVGFSQ